MTTRERNGVIVLLFLIAAMLLLGNASHKDVTIVMKAAGVFFIAFALCVLVSRE